MIDKCIIFGDNESYFIEGNIISLPANLDSVLYYPYENEKGNMVLTRKFQFEVQTIVKNNIETINDTIKFLKQAKRKIKKENQKIIIKKKTIIL